MPSPNHSKSAQPLCADVNRNKRTLLPPPAGTNSFSILNDDDLIREIPYAR
jgi:hypothetical protein